MTGIDFTKLELEAYNEYFHVEQPFEWDFGGDEITAYENETLEVFVRVPPHSQMSVTALVWTSTVNLRWRSPNTDVLLEDGRSITVDEYEGVTRITSAEHFHIQYRCWTVVDGEELPCPAT